MPDERIGHDPLAWLSEEGEEPSPTDTPREVAPSEPAEEGCGEAAMAVTPEGDEGGPFRFEEELAVPVVAELQQRLSGWLDGRAEVLLDAGAVERVDGAGLQLLVSFIAAVEAQGGSVRWQGCTEALREAAILAGLSDILRIG